MEDLKWCKHQKGGISLIEPNENLVRSYINEAKDTLSHIQLNGNKWNIIMAYYACYNALYSILQKSGIRCEIHNCTLKLMSYIEGFSQEDQQFMLRLKEDRIANQYYLEQRRLNNLVDVQRFILKCEQILEIIDITALRRRISEK